MNKRRVLAIVVSILVVLWSGGTSVNAQTNGRSVNPTAGADLLKLFNQREFAAAEKLLDEMLSADSTNSNLILARATAYSHQKKFRRAEFDFRRGP